MKTIKQYRFHKFKKLILLSTQLLCIIELNVNLQYDNVLYSYCYAVKCTLNTHKTIIIN